VEKQKQGPATRTISRAIAILQAFDETRPELGVTEIGELTGLDKSTVYRLLSALQQGGLIERNAETTRYHLGFGLLRLAGLALQHLDLPRIARPFLQELADRTEETVSLSFLAGQDRIVHVAVVESPHRVRNVEGIGGERPLYAGSEGKVMLAYLPEARSLALSSEGAAVDAVRLRRELALIRERGYGLATGELEEGLSDVAAPIRNHEGQVVAVLGVSGPSFRLPMARLVELGQMTQDTASRISREIGYVG
jgi:DNA-binding IclR family transcriptional regulator